ncbi:MAG: helix-turn-helix domain-containing protein [Proteobacteria bacterium]|nr:helix-turn-helix domain-containing protein [Pseudomonadota bacterium]MBU4597186.1 helix-turn-helix domain-containing protein [Pseudomonadota bacterium]
MLGATKKPPIDAKTTASLTFRGPANKVAAAVTVMRKLGFSTIEEAKPWREALPYLDDELPGVFLAGARYREGLTQAQLAEATGIPRRHISEMEHNKRPIGKQSAKKLAQALRVDPRRLRAV